jgi:hypothetical protein
VGKIVHMGAGVKRPVTRRFHGSLSGADSLFAGGIDANGKHLIEGSLSGSAALSGLATGEGVDDEIPSYILFHSDWSTATGNSSDARRDTDKDYPWDSTKGSDEDCLVVATSSLAGTSPGFTNALLIRNHASTGAGVRLTGSLPNVAVGERRNYRAYMNVVWPDAQSTTDNSYHPFDIRDNPGGSIYTSAPMHIKHGHGGLGDVDARGLWWVGHENGGSAGDNAVLGQPIAASNHPLGIRYGETGLAKHEWWGIEIAYEVTSPTTYEIVDAWVYDDEGNTAYNSSDHYSRLGEVSLASAPIELDADGGTIMFTYQQCGVNGFPASVPEGHDLVAWGAVAIAKDVEQIGPWNGVY